MMPPEKFPNALPLPLGFRWCKQCQASREKSHVHGDELETLSREELLALVRVLREKK